MSESGAVASQTLCCGEGSAKLFIVEGEHAWNNTVFIDHHPVEAENRDLGWEKLTEAALGNSGLGVQLARKRKEGRFQSVKIGFKTLLLAPKRAREKSKECCTDLFVETTAVEFGGRGSLRV